MAVAPHIPQTSRQISAARTDLAVADENLRFKDVSRSLRRPRGRGGAMTRNKQTAATSHI
ncbi:hypothetical protein [Streptomyces sp. NPDC059076]|uniref:hypothetical protein n=1 Tax=unclassified Streptomyces TaxID=2593676 RepID=UPI00367E9675